MKSRRRFSLMIFPSRGVIEFKDGLVMDDLRIFENFFKAKHSAAGHIISLHFFE